MRKWIWILIIALAVYYFFFRDKKKDTTPSRVLNDPIAQEVFERYNENQEIAKLFNPKTNCEVILNHRGLRHILERHHPAYPEDPDDGKSPCFDPNTTTQELLSAIETTLRIGERNRSRERRNRPHNVVYEANITLHGRRGLYRLVLNTREECREYVVTFFLVGQ